MADRHARTFRAPMRPDRARYERVLAKLRAEGRTMSDAFEQWLKWMDGETDEPPDRPRDTPEQLS
jgi:hypothetical protein